MLSWLKSWYTTLRIAISDRELYRQLSTNLAAEDFIEVDRPSACGFRKGGKWVCFPDDCDLFFQCEESVTEEDYREALKQSGVDE